MKRTKRTIIRTETKELLIVRQIPKSGYAAWCGECQKEVDWLSLIETAVTSGFHPREIFRLIDTGELHFREVMEGNPFICSNSPAIIDHRQNNSLISAQE